jgi:hypothetical protein
MIAYMYATAVLKRDANIDLVASLHSHNVMQWNVHLHTFRVTCHNISFMEEKDNISWTSNILVPTI